MKSSLIYLGAALAQPLILFLIRKIGGAGMNSVQLPYFRMVHELDGRVRYFSELMKDREFCRLFDEKLNSLPGITGVRSNPLTGTSLVTHTLAKEGIREIFDKLNKDLREQFQSARKPSPVADLLSSFFCCSFSSSCNFSNVSFACSSSSVNSKIFFLCFSILFLISTGPLAISSLFYRAVNVRRIVPNSTASFFTSAAVRLNA